MLLRSRPAHPEIEAFYRARGDWLGLPFSHYFEGACKRFGSREVLVDGKQRLSYDGLASSVAKIALGLSELGVRRGTVVAIQLPNWWETVVISSACLRLGAVLNPVLPAYRDRELEFILREGEAEVLFVPGTYRKFDHRVLAADLAARLAGLRRVVVVRDEPGAGQVAFEDLSRRPGALPEPPAGSDLMLLMYTSGTTADPKGVLHSHDTLLHEARSLEGVHALGENDSVLMPSPLTHVSGLIHAILLPFVLGTRAVLMEQWNPDRAIELISDESITYMVGAPVFLSDLAFHPKLAETPPRTLRLFSCGGAGVSPELVLESRRRLGCVVKRVYGSTEYPTLTTTGPGDPPERGATTEGRLIGAAEMKIVGDGSEELPPGREGEIFARGPECFLGYRNASLQPEAFTADGWFRTGDLGLVDREGYLTVTGRKKDIVIRKGEKVSAAEIEGLITRHPAVAEAAVIALPDPVTGERACACVELRAERRPSLEELCDFLRAQGLPSHKLPEALEIVEALPRTASGKVRKQVLRERILKRP